MSGDPAHDCDDFSEQEAVTGQKRGHLSALELVPRKKPSV